jgi:hypothetical protein
MFWIVCSDRSATIHVVSELNPPGNPEGDFVILGDYICESKDLHGPAVQINA